MSRIIGNIKKIGDLPVPARAVLVYTLASFITRGFHLITTPLFTRVMTVEQIGTVSNFSTWQSFISDIVTLGLCSGAINIALKEYKNDRIGFIKNSQTLIFIGVLITGIATVLLYPVLERVLRMPIQYIILMYVCIFFNSSRSFWMSLNRYEYRYKAVGIITIMTSVLTASISLFAVVAAKNKGIDDLATVRLYASSGVSLIFAVFFSLKFFLNKKPLVKKEYCKFAFFVCAPMIIHTLAKSVLSASDRIMINAISGAKALGYYSVLYTLSSLALIFWDAINASLVPYIFNKLENEKNGEKEIDKMGTAMLTIFAGASILLVLFAPEIVTIIATDKYMDAIFIMPPVAAGIFFTCMYTLYSDIIMFHKKTKYIMISTMVAAAFNLISNLIFINLIGYVAAAYTTLVSYMLLALIYCKISKCIHGYSIYSDRKIWTIAFLVVISSLSCNVLYKYNIFRYCAIIAIIIVAIMFKKKIIRLFRVISDENM